MPPLERGISWSMENIQEDFDDVEDEEEDDDEVEDE